jgi:hypothetical protein
MREEETLASDVNNKFYELYNMPVFKNIAISEQKHMDAMLNLLTGYGLTDPVVGKGPGEFTPAFQTLYDELITKGTNLTEALKVGVEIEELDIADLEKAIDATEVPNLLTVFLTTSWPVQKITSRHSAEAIIQNITYSYETAPARGSLFIFIIFRGTLIRPNQ